MKELSETGNMGNKRTMGFIELRSRELPGVLENPAELNAKRTKPATFLPKIGVNIAVEAVALPEDMRVQGAKLLESSQSCLLTTRISG